MIGELSRERSGFALTLVGGHESQSVEIESFRVKGSSSGTAGELSPSRSGSIALSSMGFFSGSPRLRKFSRGNFSKITYYKCSSATM